MLGTIWITPIWLTIIVVLWRRRSALLTRENLALAVALLGTHVVSGRAADETLQQPVVLETAIRGSLSAAALMMVLPLLVARRSWILKSGTHQGLLALTLYGGIAALSSLYSVSPLTTGAKAFELLTGILIVWAIALRRNDPTRFKSSVGFIVLLEASLLVLAVVGFFALPGVFSFPSSRPGFLLPAQLGSPYSSSNGLSASGALISAYAAAHLVMTQKNRSRIGWASLVSVGTIAILLASGRQGVVIWVASLGLLLWLYRRKLFGFVVGPAAIGLLMAFWQPISVAFLRDRPEQTLALTGRISWWQSAVEALREHPLTGFGFGAGGRFVALARIGSENVSSVHGGYVEALVGVGIIGALALGYCMWRAAAWALPALRNRNHPGLPLLLIPLLLHTVVSPGIGGWLNSDFLLFALLLATADEARISHDQLIGSRADPSIDLSP